MSLAQRLHDGLGFERTDQRLEVERLLPMIERGVTRRHRLRVGVIVAVAACLVVILGLLLAPVADRSRSVPPVGPTETADVPDLPVSTSPVCSVEMFTCSAGRPVAVQMGVDVRWTRLDAFGGDVVFIGDDAFDEVILVDNYRNDTGVDQHAGVSIARDVRAASLTRTGRIEPGVAADAEAIARWLGKRSDLRSSPVEQDRLDGMPAWTLTFETRVPEREATVTCNDTFACSPIIHVAGGGTRSTQGVFKGLINRFTFADVPGAGVVAVWSWAMPEELLAGNEEFIESIRFGSDTEP